MTMTASTRTLDQYLPIPDPQHLYVLSADADDAGAIRLDAFHCALGSPTVGHINRLGVFEKEAVYYWGVRHDMGDSSTWEAPNARDHILEALRHAHGDERTALHVIVRQAQHPDETVSEAFESDFGANFVIDFEIDWTRISEPEPQQPMHDCQMGCWPLPADEPEFDRDAAAGPDEVWLFVERPTHDPLTFDIAGDPAEPIAVYRLPAPLGQPPAGPLDFRGLACPHDLAYWSAQQGLLESAHFEHEDTVAALGAAIGKRPTGFLVMRQARNEHFDVALIFEDRVDVGSIWGF